MERSSALRSGRVRLSGLRHRQRPQHLVRVHHRRRRRQGGALGRPGRPRAGDGVRALPCLRPDRRGSSTAAASLRAIGAPASLPICPSGSKGEYKLPLYADLPSMPEHERRAHLGLDGRQRGQDAASRSTASTHRPDSTPTRTCCKLNVMPPDKYNFTAWWGGYGPRQWRAEVSCGGGVVFDWDLRTTLEGLYAAGVQIAGGDHAGFGHHRQVRGQKGGRVRGTARSRVSRPAAGR